MHSYNGKCFWLNQSAVLTTPPPPPPHTHTCIHTKYFVVNLPQKTDPFTPFGHLAESDFTQSDFCNDIVHVHIVLIVLRG